MSLLLIVCGWLVVLVFTVAGVSKLNDASATANALHGFGLPQAVSRGAARTLPVIELAVAAMLLAPMIAWAGAVAAAVLLLGFTTAIVVSLLRGRRPSCNCFGQVRSTPITWRTAARNAFLAFAALALVNEGPASLDQGLLGETVQTLAASRGMSIALATLAVLVLVQFWMVMHLARQQGRLLLKIDNLELTLHGAGIAPGNHMLPTKILEAGMAAPPFVATTLAGHQTGLPALLEPGASLVLLFVSAECPPCKDLLAELPGWRGVGRNPERLVVISSGTMEANRGKFPNVPAGDVLIQTGLEINEAYGVIATPSAVRIERDGTVGSPVAIGRDAIKAMFEVSSANAAPAMRDAFLTA